MSDEKIVAAQVPSEAQQEPDIREVQPSIPQEETNTPARATTPRLRWQHAVAHLKPSRTRLVAGAGAICFSVCIGLATGRFEDAVFSITAIVSTCFAFRLHTLTALQKAIAWPFQVALLLLSIYLSREGYQEFKGIYEQVSNELSTDAGSYFVAFKELRRMEQELDTLLINANDPKIDNDARLLKAHIDEMKQRAVATPIEADRVASQKLINAKSRTLSYGLTNLAVLGAWFYALRRESRLAYGAIELGFALAAATHALNQLLDSTSTWAWTAIGASVYLTVRGIENFQQGWELWRNKRTPKLQ